MRIKRRGLNIEVDMRALRPRRCDRPWRLRYRVAARSGIQPLPPEVVAKREARRRQKRARAAGRAR